MRTHGRRQLDWTKPFKLVPNKKEFEELETNDELQLVENHKKDKQPPTKEQIGTPRIDTVLRISIPKSDVKINPNYIKIHPHLNLPKVGSYELTEVDHVFIKSAADKYKINDKPILTEELLERIIIELEGKAGRDAIIPRKKDWLIQFLNQSELKDYMKLDAMNKFAQGVYNFWKSRREELRFPLLRLNWRPEVEEIDHLLAFRSRNRQKRSHRKANLIDEEETLLDLAEQFEIACKISSRVKLREQLKLNQLLTQLHSFNNEFKSLMGPLSFLEDLTGDTKQRDREAVSQVTQGYEEFKSKRKFNDADEEPEEELKVNVGLSVVNFLATVAEEIQRQKIDQERFFPVEEKKEPVTGTSIVAVAAEKETQNQEQVLCLQIKRIEDLLIRCIGKETASDPVLAPSMDFMDYEVRKISCFYFGMDDEGDNPDLKKSIAANFKKFQSVN